MSVPPSASPAASPSSFSRAVSAAVTYVRRNPVAIGFAAVVLVAAVVSGTAVNADAASWGAGLSTTVAQRHVWTVITALITPDSAVDLVLSILFALIALPFAQRTLGAGKTMISMAVIGVAAIVVGLTLQWVFVTLIQLWDTPVESENVLDPAVVVTGALMAATGLAGPLWRRRIRLIGFAILAVFVLYSGDPDSWFRMTAALIGLGVGAVLGRRRGIDHSWQRSSQRERRSIVGALVAVTALGPLTALQDGGRGPLAHAITAFSRYDELCVSGDCDDRAIAFFSVTAGQALLALVPLFLLIIAATGLVAGRRSAWWCAVVVNAVFLMVALGEIVRDLVVGIAPADLISRDHELWFVSAVGVPAALLVVLMLNRRAFPVRVDPTVRRRIALVLGVVAGASVVGCLIAGFTVGSVAARGGSVERLDIVIETLRRYFPPAFFPGSPMPPFSLGAIADVALPWLGICAWTIVVIALIWGFRHPAASARGESDRYRELLRRGGGTLGFLGTWQGNSYWYGKDGQSAIAYREVGDVALAIADPLVPVGREADVMREFIADLVAQGRVPVFYSIHEQFLPVFDDLGWEAFSVGEETVIPLPGLSFSGKAWQKVRHPLTKAEREGMRAEWTTWAELSAARVNEIVEIDEMWIADKSLPEMGFTLGSLEEAKDPDVGILLALDADDRILAVTSWMPSWRGGERWGYTLDFMRRRPDGPNGVMEFVIAKAALLMSEQGLAELSLSGAPLAKKPTVGESNDEPESIVSSFLGWVSKVLEPAYGFASLFRFKAKFRPDYRTIYLAYADPVQLPKIGMAISKAYLPTANGRDLVALLRTARETRSSSQR